MGGYSLNPERIEEELAKLRMDYFENRFNLTAEEEGVLLEQIDTLKKDLKFAKGIEDRRLYAPNFVREMKITHSGNFSVKDK